MRTYALAYSSSAGTSQSLLATVQQYGNDATVDGSGNVTGGSALPATTLAYSPENNTFSAPTNTYTAIDFTGYTVSTADVTGNGRADLVYTAQTLNDHYVWTQLSNGDGTFSAPIPSFYPIDFVGYTQYIGDVNGDGKADLIYVAQTAAEDYVWVRLSNGDGTFSAPIPSFTAINFTGYTAAVADVNGDGKADLVYTAQTLNDHYVWTQLSNGDGTFSAPIPSFYPIDFVGYTQYIGDVNGDGKADLIYVAQTAAEDYVWVRLSNGDGTFSAPIPSFTAINFTGYTAAVADVNGDGKADLVYTAQTLNDHYVWTQLSNGDGTFSAPIPSFYPIDFVGYTQYIGDVNGDGKADLIYVAQTAAEDYVWVRLSNGDGTFSAPMNTYTAIDFVGYSLMPGDISGDGKTDLIYVAPTTTEDYVWTQLATGPPSNLLSSVTSPLGGATSFTYTPSSAWSNTDLPLIVNTVSQMQVTDGRGNTTTTSYTYDGGYYYAPDRDFRGFAHVYAYQALSGTPGPSNYTSKTKTTFNQDIVNGVGQPGVLKGTISQVLVTSIEGHTREVDNTYDSMSLGTGATGCSPNSSTACFPRLEKTLTTVTDAGYTPYAFRTEYTYDPTYLNVTQQDKYAAATGTTPIDVHTSYVYTSGNSNFLANWIIAKPTDVKVQDTNYNIVSRKWADYDPNIGNLLDEEVCLSNTPNTGCTARNSTQNALTTYTYYTDGNVQTITDPLNHTKSLTYDATKTYVYQTTNALNQVTTTFYNTGLGKITQKVPPYLKGTSSSFTYSYDAFGRISQRNRPDGGYTAYTYNNIGSPTSQYRQKQDHIVGGASVLDHYTSNYFDGLGRTYQTSSTGPGSANIMTQTTYDALGRVHTTTVPYLSGNTSYLTTYTYDGLSRVTNTNIPDVNTSYNISISYQGLTRVATDQNNHTTSSTTDIFERLASVQDAYGTTTTYTYNVLNNLLQTVAASGTGQQNTTTMTYNSVGKKQTMTDPDMGAWSYVYDKAGNPASQTDAKSQTITFDYDAINRILHKYYSDHTVTYTYDSPSVPYSTGKLTSTSTTLNGETESDLVLSFDIMQRVISSQKNIGTTSTTIAKTYDSAGRTYQITYFPGSSQRVYSYAYDQAGNTISLHDDTGSRYLVQYSNFTALGQYQTATFPKPNNISVVSTYTYNPATGRIATLLTQQLSNGTPTATYQNLTYQQFDGKGNLKTLVDTLNSITHAYAYDNIDRLLTATGTGNNPYAQSYTYDPIGNITYKSDVGSYSYNYSNQPHAVQSAGNITLQYDADGNMTQRAVSGGDTLVISYNQDNMVTGITKNGSSYVSYTYDGRGRRIRKQNLFTGSTTLYFGQRYEVRNGVGVIHLFAGSQKVASIRSDGYEQYYHPDHLGSASVITDASGNQQETIQYYPFGTYRQKVTNPNFPVVNYTFTGHEDDDDTPFYNFKARLYDPTLGRFLSADSLVPVPWNLQSMNRYSYCLNNPLIYKDPSGHSANSTSGGVNYCYGYWSPTPNNVNISEDPTGPCTITWTCEPCPSTTQSTTTTIGQGPYTTGDPNPTTLGIGAHTGFGDPESAQACFAQPPGPDKGCAPWEQNYLGYDLFSDPPPAPAPSAPPSITAPHSENDPNDLTQVALNDPDTYNITDIVTSPDTNANPDTDTNPSPSTAPASADPGLGPSDATIDNSPSTDPDNDTSSNDGYSDSSSNDGGSNDGGGADGGDGDGDGGGDGGGGGGGGGDD